MIPQTDLPKRWVVYVTETENVLRWEPGATVQRSLFTAMDHATAVQMGVATFGVPAEQITAVEV